MNKNYSITESDYFIINSLYNLNLKEQKIIFALANMVQPDDESFKPYKFKISEFMKLLDIDTRTKYTQIPKITDELMKKVFKIQKDNILLQIYWLSSVVYEKNSDEITLKFSPYLKPYMLRINKLAKLKLDELVNELNMGNKYSSQICKILNIDKQ